MSLQISNLEKNLLNPFNKSIIIEGEIIFTKSPKGYGYGEFTLDKSLYLKSLEQLTQILPPETIMERSLPYNFQKIEIKIPRHYPVKINNSKGVLNNHQNLFAYFPYCMKSYFQENSDSNFSLEFYERSINIYNIILKPIFNIIFIESDQLIESLSENLPNKIWTFSMLHELSHQVGHWYMNPKSNPSIKVNGLFKGIMGELSSDLFSTVYFSEFIDANLINLLMKCFYYSRIGFLENESSGQLNSDNDSWEGTLILSRFIKSGALFYKKSKLSINKSQLIQDCDTLWKEVNNLGLEISQYKHKEEQDEKIINWMKNQLPFNNGSWLFPQDIRNLFKSIEHIPEFIK